MKKIYRWILGLLLLIAIVGIIGYQFIKPIPLPISAEDRSQISLLPLPANLSLQDGTFRIPQASIRFSISHKAPRVLRAVKRVFPDAIEISASEEADLHILIQDETEVYPQLNTDESYSLRITDKGIEINAGSQYGAIYALQTLKQLQLEEEKSFPQVEIHDNPRYPWRGILLDVSRHWIPKEGVLRNLEAMAAVKMNVLHWHLTDYQGFRVESKTYPLLHEKGSDGDYYSQEDIREVIEFAADRGIRVMPEFDIPGHATSWFIGYPELSVDKGPYELPTNMGIHTPIMDPTDENVYQFLAGFLGEMAALFPEHYFHIGGDEIADQEWEESERIQAFMLSKNLSTSLELQTYFNERVDSILQENGKTTAGWEEILHPDLGDQIAVQSWKGHKSLFETVQSGRMGLLSSGWYLDYKLSAETYYKVDPDILPGAVNIELDSSTWETWDLNMDFRGSHLTGSYTLFGEGEELRGVFNLMGSYVSFSHAEMNEGTLTFEIEASVGTLTVESVPVGDSVNGSLSIGLIGIDFTGTRTGGPEISGSSLPVLEKVRPLSESEFDLILGGEACMWSEVVDKQTMESRIWPSAAAIAEKLWSPVVLTNEVEDMYRRLAVLSEELESLGLRHRSVYLPMLQELTGQNDVSTLSILTDLMEEDKYYNRMAMYDSLTNNTPLNRIPDIVRAESFEVRDLIQAAQSLQEDPDNESLHSSLMAEFMKWEEQEKLLKAQFNDEPFYEDISLHSRNLASLGRMGQKILSTPGDSPTLSSETIASYQTKIAETEVAFHGTILKASEVLKALLNPPSGAE